MYKLTTKTIYELNKGESTVLSTEDKEYKDLKSLDKEKYEWFKDNSLNGCNRALVTRI